MIYQKGVQFIKIEPNVGNKRKKIERKEEEKKPDPGRSNQTSSEKEDEHGTKPRPNSARPKSQQDISSMRCVSLFRR